MTTGDTIAALATAAVPAARAVVRTSGPSAVATARRLCPGLTVTAASATRATLAFAGLTCPAWVYAFLAPRSYTGEDVVEYHLPGSPVLARLLLDDLLAGGLRSADPGEFTARGYFAGRLDLTAAEGVAATIAASNAAELAAARQLLAGELARRLRPLTDALADTLALVEVGIDFADEDVAFLTADAVRDRVGTVDASLAGLEAEGPAFESSTHVPRIVLAGRPNAGKSSLLNALAGRARAVVSPAVGTTRDALSAPVDLPRGRVDVVDVAGLEDPVDPAVTAGRRDPPDLRGADAVDRDVGETARRAIESADHVVLVRDVTDARPPVVLSRGPDLVVWTKVDLRAAPPSGHADVPAVAVSVTADVGLVPLRSALDGVAFGRPTAAAAGTARLTLNRRHRRSLSAARSALARTAGQTDAELVAADLRDALDALGAVTGSVTPDDVLGRVFSTFCIGK